MPRRRQRLTVGIATDSAKATALVPPSSSMTEFDVTMPESIVCGLQTCQEFADRKATFSVEYDGMRSMPDSRDIIFARVEALRLALAAERPGMGFDGEGRFAEAIGLHKTSWSQIKKLERDLPLTAACRIKENWGVPLDWIFYGEQAAGAQIIAKIGRGGPTDARRRKTG